MSEPLQAVESLDSVLTDEVSNDTDSKGVEQTEETKEVKNDPVEEQVSDTSEDKPEETKGETEESSTEPPSEQDNKAVPMSAFLGVKDELKQAKERLKQFEEQNAAPDPDEPDPVEDPEGFKEYTRNQIIKEERKNRINNSRDALLESKDHPDYLEKEKVFMVLVAQDRSLQDQMMNSNNPALFAYETAKKHVDGIRSEVEKSVRSELEKQIREELKSSEQPSLSEKPIDKSKSALDVPNLTKATSASSGMGAPINESLEDILGK